MKWKKIHMYLGAILLISAVVYGAWAIWANSQFTGMVISVGSTPVYFTADFSDITLNTSTTDDNQSTTAMIRNDDGDLTQTIDINVTRSDDTSDGCGDYENDCEVTVQFNGDSWGENGGTIMLPSGYTGALTTYLSCIQASCPQNVSISVTIS